MKKITILALKRKNEFKNSNFGAEREKEIKTWKFGVKKGKIGFKKVILGLRKKLG